MTDPAEHLDENRFERDLQSLYDPAFDVPAAMNDRILNRARAHFARSRATGRLLRWAGTAAAVAAILIIVVRLNMHAPPGPSLVTLAGDVDGNGRVDILDALVLAQRIESSQAFDAKLVDLNRDGIVDRRDVDAIAMSAVSLDRGGVQ